MEYFTRLRNFWFPDWNALWWLILAFPALYFFQTVVHEGTHGFTAFVDRGNFPTVAPFPHLTADGNFLNGVTLSSRDGSTSERPVPVERQDCDSPTKTSNPQLAGWIGMPQIIDIVLILIFTVIFMFWNIRSPMIRFLLRIWYFGVWIDFMFNTARHLFGFCKASMDWSRVMLRGDIGLGWFAFLTWFLWLVILCHFVWVYWSQWGKEAVEETSFWDYRWVALVLGVLSTVAVVVSLAVSDDRIDKGTAAFVVPFIIQILAVIWYGIYFGLTFKYKDQQTI
jgi:hypothetical protein